MSVAIKVNDDIAAAARAEADLMSRSMTEQIEHWARIGRALERQPGVSMARVRTALEAGLDFDDLGGDERAVALGVLESIVLDPKGDRGLQRGMAEAGQCYAVLDDAGRVVEVRPNGRRRVIADVDALKTT
ncbi:hypothetical protein [Salinisphaera sp. PC39]|uniref:TA system antitoxin ParD family protein n=1 Tax=Salinisphaera sp. PC39 TaxID=1304156 RepID=UPI00333E848E